MTDPLDKLHQVIDRWATRMGQKNASDAMSWIFALLERQFPKRWQDLPPTNLSSNGSPIQLSIDTIRPDELRIVIELSWILADRRADMSELAAALPADPARLLMRLKDVVGEHVSRFGVGFRLRDGNLAFKVYIGSDSPSDFGPWIRSFSNHGLLPRDCDQGALRLCKHTAKSSVLRACSFTDDATGALVISSIYYRSLVPFRRASLVDLLRLANVTESSPTAASVANALGFTDGTGKGCFGHTIGIGPDGTVDNLKVEFGRMPRRNDHELSLDSLRPLRVVGIESAQALCQTIVEVCGCENTIQPEILSWRGAAGGPASIVTYFPLPRPDRVL